MDDIVTRPAEEISREELYELVWQTPMSMLGPPTRNERAKLGSSLSKAPNPYAALGLLADTVKFTCALHTR